MNCAYPCKCEPNDPGIATPLYAETRRHVDAGDLDAIRQVTAWLEAGEAQCHIRYSDGEFMSILGAEGANCDGQDHLTETLGVELEGTLFQMSLHQAKNLLVGGDWRRPEGAWDWLMHWGYDGLLPWCPSQVFVNGIVSGDSMRWLQAMFAAPGQRYLVANSSVCEALQHRDLVTVPIPAQNALKAMVPLEHFLRDVLRPGDIVMWAAGLGAKPTLYRLFRGVPGTTHLDVGCFFDGLAGIKSRGWLNQDPAKDERLRTYNEVYIPYLKGVA